MNRKLLRVLAAFAAAFLLLALLLVGCKPAEEEPMPRSYQCAVYAEQGCAKFVVASGGEIEVQSGGTMDVQSGAATTFGGDVTIEGTCTGCSINETSNIQITGTLNVTGATTLNSTLDVDGAISSGTGAVTVSDSLNVTSAADFDSTVNMDGHVTAAQNVTITTNLDVDGATTLDAVDIDGAVTCNSTLDIDGDISSGTGAVTVADTLNVTGASDFDSTVNVDGALNWVTGIVSKATDYQLLVSESGSLVTQPGASGAGQAFTLPVAATGLHYCFYVHASTILTITPTGSNQIHHLTNAAGDRINNDASAGDSICLTAIDTVNWIPLQETGTWSDTD